MNKFFNAEELLETGKSVVKKQVTATTQSAKSQIQNTPTPTSSGSGTNEAGSQQASVLGDDANKDFINELYKSSNDPSAKPNPTLPNAQSNATGIQSAEDAEKLAKARKHLAQHMETYYKPTFERSPAQEESTADKLEREDQEKEAKKMEDLREEQKQNEVPMAIQMGKNKAEKFPGMSG